jgi:hypothetical protein
VGESIIADVFERRCDGIGFLFVGATDKLLATKEAEWSSLPEDKATTERCGDDYRMTWPLIGFPWPCAWRRNRAPVGAVGDDLCDHRPRYAHRADVAVASAAAVDTPGPARAGPVAKVPKWLTGGERRPVGYPLVTQQTRTLVDRRGSNPRPPEFSFPDSLLARLS